MRKNLTGSKVTVFTKFMYALGDFPFSFSTTLIGFFLMIYLTNTIGISAFWAGAIIFIGIMWDAINDPLAGFLNDNVRSKLGRRRKYIILFLFPMAIGFIMLFGVPSALRGSSEAIKVIITLLLYLLFETVITLVATPYSALINEITDDYDERTSMTTFRMISSVIGTLLSIAIPEFLGLSNASENNADGYLWMGIIFAVLMLVFGYTSVLNLREKNNDLTLPKEAFNFKTYFIDSWKSTPFRQVCLMYMVSIAMINFIQGNLVYFLNYKMLLPSLFLPVAGGVMVLAIVLMPIWAFISRKTNKKVAYGISVVITIVSLLSLYFVPALDYQSLGSQVFHATDAMLNPPYQGMDVVYIADQFTDYGAVIRILWQSSGWAYFSIFLLGFGFSGLQMLPFSMVPDAINFSIEAKKKKEGAYFGIISFVQKFGWGFGMLMTGILLNAFGYLEPAKVFTSVAQTAELSGMIVLQTEASVLAIALLFTIVPAICGILGIWFLRHYQVDRIALKLQVDANNAGMDRPIVLRVVDNHNEIASFMRLANDLYQNDPLFVPPLRNEMRTMLVKQLIKKDYVNPVIAYNAYVNGKIAGRIWLTIFMARPGMSTQKRQGSFNFFECIDDTRVSDVLFDATVAWFKDNDVDYFYGNTNPIDPDDSRGVLIEGFEDLAAVMCIYNPPYYQRLFETYGFGIDEDLFGYKLTLDDVPLERYKGAVEAIRNRFKITITSADPKHLDREIRDIVHIINHSITDDWDMRAPEPEKVHDVLEGWKHFLDFDLIKIARTESGEPIGFTMVVPNFNEVLQKMHGRLNPISLMKLFYYKSKVRTMRAMIQMVVQSYQGKGIINAMYYEYFDQLRGKMDYMDASTIGSDNFKSRNSIEKLGGKRYKVFRVYDYHIDLIQNP